MAVMYIQEYERMVITASGRAAMPIEPAIASQTVAIGAAAQSAILNVRTKFVRLHCDAICSFRVGTNPQASVAVTDPRMAANQTEYFAIEPPAGGAAAHTLRIGVIANT